MKILLTQALMKQIYPNAGASLINAFVTNQDKMAGILSNENRAIIAFANVFVESRGGTVFRENTNYRAENVVKNWKHRYPSVAAVQARFGTGAGWQLRMFDEIYGDRMGNRPNTSDGSKYVGHGLPQITGRDGFKEMSQRLGIDLVNNPMAATNPDIQPALIQAFWDWKGMNDEADRNDVVKCRELWNGGAIGLPEVKAQVARIGKIIRAYLALPTAAINVQAPTAPIDETLKEYQSKLIDMGYHEIGEPDGRIGGKTRGAFTAFCNDRHIAITVKAEAGLYREIDKAIAQKWSRPVAPERAYATAADLAPKTPAIAAARSGGLMAKIGGWISGVFGTVKATVWAFPDVNDQIYPYTSMVQQWYADLPGWVIPVCVAAVAFAIVRQTTKSSDAIVSDKQTGKYN